MDMKGCLHVGMYRYTTEDKAKWRQIQYILSYHSMAWIQIFSLLSKISCSTTQGKGTAIIKFVSTYILLLHDSLCSSGTLGCVSVILIFVGTISHCQDFSFEHSRSF